MYGYIYMAIKKIKNFLEAFLYVLITATETG